MAHAGRDVGGSCWLLWHCRGSSFAHRGWLRVHEKGHGCHYDPRFQLSRCEGSEDAGPTERVYSPELGILRVGVLVGAVRGGRFAVLAGVVAGGGFVGLGAATVADGSVFGRHAPVRLGTRVLCAV